ncbi:MAG: hypothetical protein KatS3mg053_1543 [Candidatus Roseilinea sp.]|nr:MAG: hypothetical protein KatS3mg053_1543 [Candidatus Roseilinea sp.]
MAEDRVAIMFEGEHTAEAMLATLRDLETRGAIKLDDAAIASRAPKGEHIMVAAAPSGDAGDHNVGMMGIGS